MKHKLTHLLFLSTAGSCFAYTQKSQDLDLTYTFAKVYATTISQRKSDVELDGYKRTHLSDFTWGNQGSIGYRKQLDASLYGFETKFTCLYAPYKFYKFLPQGSNVTVYTQSTPVLYATDQDVNILRHHQINLYSLDLLGTYVLSQTKHAKFTVYGGDVSGYYQIKRTVKASGNDSDLNFVNVYSHANQRTFFTGPNLKIGVEAPFFNNHLAFNLKAGAGFMITIASEKSNERSVSVEPTYGTETLSTFSSKEPNQYRFCPQADIEASLSVSFNQFMLTMGLNQFFFAYNVNGNQIFYLNYGGPFIKASYNF